MKLRFIILIDFTEYSNNLIKYAYDWGKQVNAELLFVHQITVFAPALADNPSKKLIAENTKQEALQKLKSLVKDLIHPKIPISFSVSDASLQLTLSRLSNNEFNNLLFVGLKDSDNFKKIFIGSVALNIIDNTQHIVVAMPKDITTFSHTRIFVAVTKKHALNITELDRFLKFIDHENTSINFFYLEKPNENIDEIEEDIKGLAHKYAERFTSSYSIYKGKNPFKDIKNIINNNVEELLIVQRGSRFFTDHLFRKFLINELVYEGQTPLIVLP